jgi:SAM-dependent methyltransferase
VDDGHDRDGDEGEVNESVLLCFAGPPEAGPSGGQHCFVNQFNEVIGTCNSLSPELLIEECAVSFTNCYQDKLRADEYAKLEFANTYYLAFSDLPAIIKEHVSGTRAVDFGCGTGRSTRFVRQLGFEVIGIDIAPEMIAKAREFDPDGDYRLIAGDDFSGLPQRDCDLLISLFTFDNIPGFDIKAQLFRGLANLLNDSGKLVSVVSSPEIYLHEWASFTTSDFPENAQAKSGDVVRIITTDFADRRPALDILCPDETYRELYREARLEAVSVYKPLATGDEPYRWVNETKIAPWVIYVLERTRA